MSDLTTNSLIAGATNDRLFGIHDDALRFRGQRMALLASNIANADTPGYKAQDLSFNDALRSALGPGMGGQTLALKQDQPGQLAAGGMQGNAPEQLYRVPDQPSLDGNTVDTEQERVRFMKNAVAYQTTLSFLNSRIKGIDAALKGQQ